MKPKPRKITIYKTTSYSDATQHYTRYATRYGDMLIVTLKSPRADMEDDRI